MTIDGFNIDTILQFTQAISVCVDNGDIVFLTGEIFCQRAPDLSGAKDNNLHISSESRLPSAVIVCSFVQERVIKAVVSARRRK